MQLDALLTTCSTNIAAVIAPTLIRHAIPFRVEYPHLAEGDAKSTSLYTTEEHKPEAVKLLTTGLKPIRHE